MVYSSVLRPLQPKASLWTGSTPWSWARWACCRLPPSPPWAPRRVSTTESDLTAGLLAFISHSCETCTGMSYISSAPVFQIWIFFGRIMKITLTRFQVFKKYGRARKNIKPQGHFWYLTSTRNIVLCVLTQTSCYTNCQKKRSFWHERAHSWYSERLTSI